MTTRIPPDVAKHAEALVERGAYSTTDEVLRDAMSALDERIDATRNDVAPKPNSPRAAKKKRAKRREKSLEKWIADFKAWADSHPPVGHFVDDSRDSIYE